MLTEEAVQQTAKNICFMQELEEVLSLMASANVEVIVLKGAASINLFYSDVSQRELGDIDILVRPEQEEKARELLLKAGFSLLDTSQRKFVKPSQQQCAVDLHTELYHIDDMSEVWCSAEEVFFGESKAYVLSASENLVYLCHHVAVEHGEVKGKWLIDIDLLIRYYGAKLDWAEVSAHISFYGLKVPCYWALKKIKKLYRADIPQSFLESIKSFSPVQNLVFKKIFFGEKEVSMSSYFLLSLLRPSRVFSSCFPSVKFMSQRYGVGRPLVYLYYFVRPFMLIKNGCTGLFKLIFS